MPRGREKGRKGRGGQAGHARGVCAAQGSGDGRHRRSERKVVGGGCDRRVGDLDEPWASKYSYRNIVISTSVTAVVSFPAQVVSKKVLRPAQQGLV